MIESLKLCSNGGLKIANDGMAHACCEKCEELVSRISYTCDMFGFPYIHKNGYIYSLTDTTENPIPSIFHWIDWSYDETTQKYTSRIKSLDCYCRTAVVASSIGDTPINELSYFGYGFLYHEKACEDYDCNATMLIILAQAVSNGWTLYGNGFTVRKRNGGSNYDFQTIVGCLMCAESEDRYYYITCECVSGDMSKTDATYIEHDICTCFDIREILLAYPETFGVHDVSFGNHTIAKIAYSTPEYTWAEKAVKCSGSSKFCSGIDYRTMYVSFHDIGFYSDYVVYGFVAPDGYTQSFYDPLESDYEITFDGHGEPFGTVHGLEMDFYMVFWKGSTRGDYNAMARTESFWSRSEAQNWVDEMSSTSGTTFVNNIYLGFSMEPPACPPPQLTFNPAYTYHAGYVEYDQNQDEWVGHAPYNEFTGAAYCVRWIFTNRGVIIDGDGYHDTYPILGFETCLSSFSNPPQSGWGYIENHCANSEEDEPQNIENPACCPYHGGTLVANIRTDMGGCHDSSWWDAIMAQYDDSSLSEVA